MNKATLGATAAGGLLAALATLAAMGVFDKARLTEMEKLETRADVSTVLDRDLSPLRDVDSSLTYTLGTIAAQSLEDNGVMLWGWTTQDSIAWIDGSGNHHNRIVDLQTPAVAEWGVWNRGHFTKTPLPIRTSYDTLQ